MAAMTEEKRELNEQLADSHEARTQLQNDLLEASDYMQELEQKVYDANTTSLALLKEVKDCEKEIAVLKAYTLDLKSKVAIYIPIADDPIDMKMAEFINNYPERNQLKIMFLRESQGVYEFGQKRINVRIEKGKILIRVGGGYMAIDEFLDQYTPAELEKIERRDPLKKFSEKMVVMKSIQGRQNSPLKRTNSESSPIRSNFGKRI